MSGNNSIFYTLVVIVLLLIGGPLLLAGGGMVFIGFLIVVALVTVPINIYSNRKDQNNIKRKMEARKEDERRAPQRKENIALMEEAAQEKRKREQERKRQEANTGYKAIEQMKNNENDNFRAMAVIYALQELEETNDFNGDNKAKNWAIMEKILKVDPLYFQYLVDYRYLKDYNSMYAAPRGTFRPPVDPALGEADAYYKNPLFKELDSNLLLNAMRFNGNNLGFLPPADRTEELCRFAYSSGGSRLEAIKHMPEDSPFLLKLMETNPEEVRKHRNDPDFYMHFYIKQKYFRYLNHHSLNNNLNRKLNPIVTELQKVDIDRKFIDYFLWDVCTKIIKDREKSGETEGFRFDKFMTGLESFWTPRFTENDLLEYWDEQKQLV